MSNAAPISRPARRLTANALRKMPEAWRRRLAAVAAFVQKELGQHKPTPQAKLVGLQAKVVALQAQLDALQAQNAAAPQFVPPGHFYSPIPPLHDVLANEQRVFDRSLRTLPGIDLREAAQLELLNAFAALYRDQPFAAEKKDGLRYHFENPAYSYSDAIFLHCMIRHVRPKRIIEVGSGYSSCVSLDTNELFFDSKIVCDFIEPYPELLLSLLKPEDGPRISVHARRLQDMDAQFFSTLEANDILFVDSTHVSRIGSDVNFVLFEVLPLLKPGVYVHFHDVFFPFEYPRSWIVEGRTWQEAYLLRAFLQYNRSFEVIAFNTFLEQHHASWFEEHMPLCLKNPGGSIWIRRSG